VTTGKINDAQARVAQANVPVCVDPAIIWAAVANPRDHLCEQAGIGNASIGIQNAANAAHAVPFLSPAPTVALPKLSDQ